MGKLIAFFSILFLCSVGFVLTQLWIRRRPPSPAVRTAPLLTLQEDGSIYSVDLRLAQFAERLEKEERRSQQLQQEVERLQRENAQREREIGDLEGEARRLRREVTALSLPPPDPLPERDIPQELTPTVPPSAPGADSTAPP